MARKSTPKSSEQGINEAQYRQAALEMALVGKRDLVVNPAQVVRDADRYFKFMKNGTVEPAE